MARSSHLSRLLLYAAVAAVLVALPALAHGSRHTLKNAKHQIAEMEQQWRTATLNADVSAMDHLLSEDYVGISWTGQVNNKASQMDRLRNRSLMVKRMDVSDLKVKLVGAVAIVTSRVEIDGTNDGAEFKGQFRYTRIYQRLASGIWKITNFEATRIPSNGPRTHIDAPLEH